MAMSQVPISTDAFTHKVTNPAWKTQAHLVHGGQPKTDRSIRSRSA